MGNVLLDPSCWELDMTLTLFKCPEPYRADAHGREAKTNLSLTPPPHTPFVSDSDKARATCDR